jgi:hypothetical protein
MFQPLFHMFEALSAHILLKVGGGGCLWVSALQKALKSYCRRYSTMEMEVMPMTLLQRAETAGCY